MRRWAAIAAASVLATCALVMRLPARISQPSFIEATVEPEAVPVFSVAGGEIAEVLVHPNERVSAGQLLVRLRIPDFDRELARARAAIERVQPGAADAAFDMFSRIPQSTIAQLMRSDPEVRAAEQEYVEAIHAAADGKSSRVVRAVERRKKAYEKLSSFQPGLVEGLRGSLSNVRQTLNWLEDERRHMNVYAPVSGRVELLDLAAGDTIAPSSPVLLLASEERVVIRGRLPRGGVAHAWAESVSGRRVLLDLQPGGAGEFTATAAPDADILPGQHIRLFF